MFSEFSDTLDKAFVALVISLTTAGLHADLQAQVVHWTHHPQVTGGCDVKLQPAFLSRPQSARLQQEQVCLSGRTWDTQKIMILNNHDKLNVFLVITSL